MPFSLAGYSLARRDMITPTELCASTIEAPGFNRPITIHCRSSRAVHKLGSSAPEFLGCDPDDGRRFSIHQHFPAQHVRTATEALLPIRIAEDNLRRRSDVFPLAGQKQA